MDNQITVGLFGIVGLCIGATLQFLFSKRNKVYDHTIESEARAYEDFIRGVVLYGEISRTKNSSKESEAYKTYLDAKVRICLYGNKDVVHALSRFIKLGSVIGTVEQRHAFIEIISKMRKRIKSQIGEISIDDIEIITIQPKNG